MKRLLVLAVFLAAVSARPETYREKEDFQYSRSSTDEGSKAGYYGAQRGNTGGNYERAHNMDSLAQHQLSGVVRQVEGELGDATNMRQGDVISSASTRGIYGQGNYDLSNLAGRNFQEGVSYDNSQSSHSSAASQSARYSGQSSSNSRYGSNSNLQAESSSNYHDREARYGSSYQSQSQDITQGHSAYEHSASAQQRYGQSNYNANSAGSRYSSSAPTRIIIRPGTAQIYDDNQRSESVNTDAEILNNRNSIHTAARPRHYESSYNYRKEWERHDTLPVAVPLAITTENPNFNTQSPYSYEQYHRQNNQQLYASSSRLTNNYGSETNALQSQERRSTGHISSNSDSSLQSHYNNDQSRYQSAEHQSNLQALQELSHTQENSDLRPKAYQSSYSYHKSWERQGDPYTIRPDSVASQNLQALNSDSSANHNAYASYQYGSNDYRNSHQRYTSSHNGDAECDENGHVRVARSYQSNSDHQDIGQQTQTDFGQQEQSMANIEDLGQQTQTDLGRLEDFGQQSETEFGNLQDFGQQTQEGSANLEDLGQQTQEGLANLEDLGQQTQEGSANLEDLGQQTQTDFGNLQDLGQQTQEGSANLEDLGQQSQTDFGNLQDLGQQTQEGSANLEDLGQQSQTDFGNLQDLGQQTQEGSANLEDLGQQTQTGFGNSEDLGQQTQTNFGQQSQTDFGQQTQTDFGQQTQNESNDSQSFIQQTPKRETVGRLAQGGFYNTINFTQTEIDLHGLQNYNQISQNQDFFRNIETLNQEVRNNKLFNWSNFNQQVQGGDNNGNVFGQQTQSVNYNLGQQSQVSLSNTDSLLQNQRGMFGNHGNTFDQTSENDEEKFHLVKHEGHESLRQEHNGFYHNQSQFRHRNVLPSAYYETTSQQPSSHKSNYNYSRSHEQNRNVWRDSGLDNLWGKIDKLMKDNKVANENNETKKSDEKYEINAQKSNKQEIDNKNEDIVHQYHNSNSNNNPENLNIIRSPNFGRGDIESDYIPDEGEINKNRPEVPEGFSMVTELNNVKEDNTKNNMNINEQAINEYEINYNNRGMVDKKHKNTETYERNSEEVGTKYTNHLQNTQVYNPHRYLEQQSQINWDDFHRSEKYDDLKQNQTQGNDDSGQKTQTDWNPNEYLNQQVQTAWSPSENLELPSQQSLYQTNYNVLPLFQNHNEFEHPVDTSKPISQTGKITNINNDTRKYQKLEEQNDNINSTIQFGSTTLQTPTEKPGFWQSVGKKYSDAKDKFVSWFYRS